MTGTAHGDMGAILTKSRFIVLVSSDEVFSGDMLDDGVDKPTKKNPVPSGTGFLKKMTGSA
jgi:hypothetical protein